MNARKCALATLLSVTLQASLAVAQDMESMQSAMDLGSVLGSEDACKLTYDQAAISAWIDANVRADDMSFASTLNMTTTGSRMQVGEMTESSLTAHCRQIERTAMHYGFTK